MTETLNSRRRRRRKWGRGQPPPLSVSFVIAALSYVAVAASAFTSRTKALLRSGAPTSSTQILFVSAASTLGSSTPLFWGPTTTKNRQKKNATSSSSATVVSDWTLVSHKKADPKKRRASVRDQRWQEDMEALMDFQKTHGHVNVPQSERRLYQFCKNVRQNYKNIHQRNNHNSRIVSTTATSTERRSGPALSLTLDRIRQLEAIDFPWTPRDVSWKEKYDQLYEYYQQHETCSLPTESETHKALRLWVTNQRTRYRKGTMPADQVELLQALEFSWTPQDERWWDQYRQLKDFVQTQGHFRISGTQENKLRMWKNAVRRQCREYVISVTLEGTTEDVHVTGLTPERIEALRKIKFCWLPTPGPLKEQPPNDIFRGYQ